MNAVFTFAERSLKLIRTHFDKVGVLFVANDRSKEKPNAFACARFGDRRKRNIIKNDNLRRNRFDTGVARIIVETGIRLVAPDKHPSPRNKVEPVRKVNRA